MTVSTLSQARAVADLDEGLILATVEIAASPERIFRALTTAEITQWWGNPGIFDTDHWRGDLRVGGQWQASGTARGRPYRLSGEFLEIDPPRRLVHTWLREGEPATASTVSYTLVPIDGGTRLTLRHWGAAPEFTRNNCAGWETSLRALETLLAG